MRTGHYPLRLVATLCTLFVPPCYAAQSLTSAQALAFVRIGDLHFSPDGSKLACVVSSYRWDALPRIRVIDVATGASREITPVGKSERSPQWAADGTLAFLSNRGGGRTQIYTLSAQGADPMPLTSQKFGIDRFHWSGDGRLVAYLARDDDAPSEDSGPQVADAESNLARLWIINPVAHTVQRVPSSGYRIDDFQWQDGTHILVMASAAPRVDAYTDSIFSVTIGSAEFRLIHEPPQPFDSLLISPDTKQFAVRSTGTHGPVPRDLFVGAIGGGPLRNVSAAIGLAVADVKWHEPGSLWLLAVDGFDRRIFRLTGNGTWSSIRLARSVAAFDVSNTGQLAFVGEDFANLPEIFLRNRSGSVRQLTRIQEGFEGVALAPTTTFRTVNPEGMTIEATLMQPSEAERGKLPLVLLVHGGPASNFSAGYGWDVAWAQFLATHGYQVLMVNPRGSNGYSEEFLKANRGDWGGGDYRDLMLVLDAVLAKGGTDPERLGIGGWSYGGEMAAWATTQTARFKAAVVGAGVFDQQAEFETEREPQADEWYFGTPWEHPDVFARNSPATYIRNAHTPTLILGGKDDTSNPIGQSQGLYRALKHLGVETEMVLYPDEGHSPRRLTYNIDMFDRILGWYDRHLQPP